MKKFPINKPFGMVAQTLYHLNLFKTKAGLHSAVGSVSDCRSRGREVQPQSSYITFTEIDHEIISMAILPFLLILKRQMQAKVSCVLNTG